MKVGCLGDTSRLQNTFYGRDIMGSFSWRNSAHLPTPDADKRWELKRFIINCVLCRLIN